VNGHSVPVEAHIGRGSWLIFTRCVRLSEDDAITDQSTEPIIRTQMFLVYEHIQCPYF
jgi:hypothetical protein